MQGEVGREKLEEKGGSRTKKKRRKDEEKEDGGCRDVREGSGRMRKKEEEVGKVR